MQLSFCWTAKHLFFCFFFQHSLAPEHEKWKINVGQQTWHKLADWLARGQQENKWTGNTMLLGIKVGVMTPVNESKWLSAPEMQLIERKSNTFIIWQIFFFFPTICFSCNTNHKEKLCSKAAIVTGSHQVAPVNKICLCHHDLFLFFLYTWAQNICRKSAHFVEITISSR